MAPFSASDYPLALKQRLGMRQSDRGQIFISDGDEFNVGQDTLEVFKSVFRCGGVGGDVVEDEACENELVGRGQGLDGLFVLGGAHGRIIPIVCLRHLEH